MVPPTVEQVEAVRSALAEPWRAIPVVLAGSGLRIVALKVPAQDVITLRTYAHMFPGDEDRT